MKAAPPQEPVPLVRHKAGPVSVYIRPDLSDQVRAEDIVNLPRLLRSLPGQDSRQAGTPTLWLWHPPWWGESGLVVRQYAHGGACGRLAGTLFAGSARMLREFELTIRAERRGVPVAPAVALRLERTMGFLVRAHLVTQAIPEARNLAEVLADPSAPEQLGRAQRRKLAAAVARAIAAMHGAGIVHADLNLKNILVRDAFGRPEAFIVDLDGAAWTPLPSLRQRMGNLLRLDQSVCKWAASRRLVTAADRLRLLRLCLEQCPEWLSQWHQIARRWQRSHWRHRWSRQPGC